MVRSKLALWRRGLLDEPSDLVSLAYSEIGVGFTNAWNVA